MALLGLQYNRPFHRDSAFLLLLVLGPIVWLSMTGFFTFQPQLSPDAPSYGDLKERYLSRFPQAEMMFGFADFALWELRLEDAHFVLGFGQAFVSTATNPTRWVHEKVERLSARKD
jgi:hypothetical protein